MTDPALIAALGRGAVLGFSIAAPLGPIGVLCIRRTLAEGRTIGLGGAGHGALGAATLVTGVVIGSALWWLALSAAVDRLRGRFDARGLVWVNRISGAIIAGVGLATLLSLRGRTS